MGKYFIDHIYWALEDGFLNLTGGVPIAMGAGDTHQAFNPCHKAIDIPKPVYEDKIEYTSDSILPNYDISYTEKITPGRCTFPNGNGMDYRDPFLMLTIFPHKAITGTWSGGPATYGKIIGDFTAFDKLSSIMMQYGMTDGVTPINRCLNGVLNTEYSLGYVPGNLLKEKVRLEATFGQTNTQAFTHDADFDDNFWSLWSLKGATRKYRHASEMALFWDESHAAEFAGLKVQEATLVITVPHQFEMYSNKLYNQDQWIKNCKFAGIVKGILYGNTEYNELDSLFESKTKKDLRMQWDSSASKLKWLQIDDAFINKLDAYRLPSKEEARKVAFTLLGKSAQYEGNFENLPTPASRINV